MTTGGTLRRLERVLTMVPYVLDHPGVSIDDLAERFGASPEEILADLDVLGYCGLPGYGGGDLIEVRLLGDRVSVAMADYFRRPLRLTLREALTLLLAARAFGDVTPVADDDPLGRAAAKLEQLLGTEPAAGTPALAVAFPASPALDLKDVREAAASGTVLRIVYRSESKAETTTRDVEPWRLTLAGGHWYLQGWCRSADGPRDFRLDRVREAVPTGETVPAPAAPVDPPVYRPGPDDVRVVVEVTPEGRWITDWIVVEDTQRHGEQWRITFWAATTDWAARLVLRLAGHARVLEPPGLESRVQQLAGSTLARYDDD